MFLSLQAIMMFLGVEDYGNIAHISVHSSVEDFIHALQQCRRTKNLLAAKYVHTLVCSRGLEAHGSIGNYLVPVFVECNGISQARQVFERSVHVNEFSWTSLISAESQCGHLNNALTFYHKMQEVNVCPSCHTLVALLKACSMAKNIMTGQEIHLDVAEMGFEEDPYVGNALIDMYAKCGSLYEAREVLNEMPDRGVVQWTTLMAGYVEHGPYLEALLCFEQMQLDGLVADAFSFTCCVKACGLLGCIEKGMVLHKELIHKGFDKDLFVGSSLVAMYAKFGSLIEAQETFDKLSTRDIVVWNSLLTGYAEHGFLQDAWGCLEEMKVHGIFPDAISLACFLKCCMHIGAMSKAHEIVREIKLQKLESHPSLIDPLISLYAKNGLHQEAHQVLNNFHGQDVVAWTALITAYVEGGYISEALEGFRQMREAGVSADAFVLGCILKSCGINHSPDMCHSLYIEVVEKGFEGDPFIISALISAYANCSFLVEARNVFESLPEREIVLWNALLGGHIEHGCEKEVLPYLERMQVEGIAPNAITYALSLKACGNLGAMSNGAQLYIEATCRGLDTDFRVGGALISMYSECGSPSEVREVFNKLPYHSIVDWSLLIKGYAINHKGSMIIECLEEMQKEGVKPDSLILTCLLGACSHGGLVSEGWKYFNSMKEEYNIEPTKEHYTCMIDLLSRSGYLYEAERLIEIIPTPSEGTWAALLSGCKTYVEEDLGSRCLQQLIERCPDDATWYAIMADLYACSGQASHARRLEEIRKHVGARKKPASAMIEINKRLHEFVIGDNEEHPELMETLREIGSRAKGEGYFPDLESHLKPCHKEIKDVGLCGHAEKLAIAFGLLNSEQGETLRVSKNLRMCNDCHNAIKIISRLEKREIILRDECCIHRFKEGFCSCGDLF